LHRHALTDNVLEPVMGPYFRTQALNLLFESFLFERAVDLN
jgi:hypothetical protein